MPRTAPRRWTRWVIGAVALALVLVVGGPFVYIHFIEGKAPAPLSLSTVSTATSSTTVAAAPAGVVTTVAAGTATPVAGTWNVAAGSVAGYRIKETLFGQSNTAVGRTSTITGSLTIGAAGVTAAHFSVDMTTVKSDRSERDDQFQGRIMDTSTYPTATFVLGRPIDVATVPGVGTTISDTATGSLTLHGTTKAVTFALQARRDASSISISGSIPIVFGDYGINNPSGGPATTADNGILEFLLVLSHL